VIRVIGPIWLWSGGQGSWHFLTVPEEQSDDIRAHGLAHRGGFGSVKVEASIDGPSTSSGQAVVWRTSVFPQKAGGYILPVKASVRRDAGLAAGDQVSVEIEIL
jgi:hypothetical protein